MEAHWAISVNGNWRPTFTFDGQDAVLVDYVDYQQEIHNMTSMHNPAHPGEVLREYLDNITVTETADRLGVTRAALSRILNGSHRISADMALRLQDALGTSAEMWLGMQKQYELWVARKHKRPKVTPILERAA